MINFKKVKNNLDIKDIIKILKSWGITKNQVTNDGVIFPTACHNGLDSSAKMKLYYYNNTKLFKCYTECGDLFDIFELGARISKIDGGRNKNIVEVAEEIVKVLDLNIDVSGTEKPRFVSPLKPVTRTEMLNPYKPYDKKVLKHFKKKGREIWKNEGISEEVLDKYGIGYYSYLNKITIPHFDYSGNLIGIRGRALTPEDIAKGKYKPLTVNNILYTHSASFNLYGLNFTKENIKKSKVCYIFEGEKSVLLLETYYKENNCAVAVCGSDIKKHQIMRIVNECGPHEIIICFDREFETLEEMKLYKNKMSSFCEKFSRFSNMSFTFDNKKLTKYKDSPIDRGIDIFEQLLKTRITGR